MTPDPELIEFAEQAVTRLGGVAERQDDGVMAVLPQTAAQKLDVPEEVVFGTEAAPLLYGSPVLERLIQAVTQEIPLVLGHIEVPYVKKSGFEQQLAQDFTFVNARVHVASRADARTTYMVLTSRYVAMSDERREGLVETGIHENSGAVVDDFEHLWRDQHPVFYTRETMPPHFPTYLEDAVAAALQEARRRAERELVDFVTSMRRRLQRDVANTREYYQALEREMQASLSNPNLGDTQRQERQAKIADLPREMERKVADLQQKYAITLSLQNCAVARLLVDVSKVVVEIDHKKHSRTVSLSWNPVTGRFDPLACERCLATIRQIHFAPQPDELQLICQHCAER